MEDKKIFERASKQCRPVMGRFFSFGFVLILPEKFVSLLQLSSVIHPVCGIP
jgi:hypothetical protein